jgi:hypothetical protein
MVVERACSGVFVWCDGCLAASREEDGKAKRLQSVVVDWYGTKFSVVVSEEGEPCSDMSSVERFGVG